MTDSTAKKESDSDYQRTAAAKAVIGAHVGRVRAVLSEIIAGLWSRGNGHDATKLSDEELPLLAKHLPAMQAAEYGSPEYREALKLIRPALDHHYRENPHHPEHHYHGIDGMTLIDAVEMFADWYAASRGYNPNGDFKKSMAINTERFKVSSQLARIFENTAKWLSRNPNTDGGGPLNQGG